LTDKPIVANMAAKKRVQPRHSTEMYWGGIVLACLWSARRFFEPVALIETGLQGASDGKTEEAYA
jgi:hypothetical protein